MHLGEGGEEKLGAEADDLKWCARAFEDDAEGDFLLLLRAMRREARAKPRDSRLLVSLSSEERRVCGRQGASRASLSNVLRASLNGSATVK